VKAKDIRGRIKRSSGGCVFCNVNLCNVGDCWWGFHSNQVDY